MNQQTKLIVAVIVCGLLAAMSCSSNFSVSKFINDNVLNKKDNYVSPYGPKINKEWVGNWESERAK